MTQHHYPKLTFIFSFKKILCNFSQVDQKRFDIIKAKKEKDIKLRCIKGSTFLQHIPATSGLKNHC